MADVLENLKKLGDRGLLIRERIGDTSKYYFVLEEQWMARKIDVPPPEMEELAKAGAVVGQPKGWSGAFVSFSKLHVAGSKLSKEQLNAVDGARRASQKDEIFIHEHDRFYAVPRSDWETNALPEGAEGDAGTLVDRGAVAANIPDDDIPIGTFCVLVNLGLLNQPAR